MCSGARCKEALQDCTLLYERSSEILTAIVHGMRKDAPQHVQLAATQALSNSLIFIHTNFKKDEERNIIMQVLCEAKQSPFEKNRVSAMECMVSIVNDYYEYMEAYMSRALFAVSSW